MSGLYFLGIKKSKIKKTPPFKYLFDWRDKKNYQHLLQDCKGEIEDVSPAEAILNHIVNEKSLKLIFRKFPSSDLSVLHQVFHLDCYGPIVKKITEYFPSNSPLRIIDAGGNVGYSSIYFKIFFPFAEIITIEPDERNLRQLEKNILINNIWLKDLVKGALWFRPAFLEVLRDFRDNRDASIIVQETRNKTTLQGFGFDEILKKNNWDQADLVKIDIEGGERFLFDTEEKADNILKKTNFLAIEIHDEFNIRSAIYRHLDRNGFEYFESGDLTLATNKNKVSARFNE